MMTNLEALFAGERHHYLPITYPWTSRILAPMCHHVFSFM